jgi:hypothetical protein
MNDKIKDYLRGHDLSGQERVRMQKRQHAQWLASLRRGQPGRRAR